MWCETAEASAAAAGSRAPDERKYLLEEYDLLPFPPPLLLSSVLIFLLLLLLSFCRIQATNLPSSTVSSLECLKDFFPHRHPFARSPWFRRKKLESQEVIFFHWSSSRNRLSVCQSVIHSFSIFIIFRLQLLFYSDNESEFMMSAMMEEMMIHDLSTYSWSSFFVSFMMIRVFFFTSHALLFRTSLSRSPCPPHPVREALKNSRIMISSLLLHQPQHSIRCEQQMNYVIPSCIIKWSSWLLSIQRGQLFLASFAHKKWRHHHHHHHRSPDHSDWLTQDCITQYFAAAAPRVDRISWMHLQPWSLASSSPPPPRFPLFPSPVSD